jgi:hypothetical protein
MELYVAEPTPVRHITPEQESYNGNSSPASSRYNRINRPNLSVPHDKALWECIKKNQSRHVNHSFIGPQTNASKSLLRDVCCDEFDALGFVWLFGCLCRLPTPSASTESILVLLPLHSSTLTDIATNAWFTVLILYN